MKFLTRLFVKSKYVDLNDLENPIKEYTQMIGLWKTHPEIYKQTNIYVQGHQVTLEDSLFEPISINEPIKFNKVCEKENTDEFQSFALGVNALSNIPYTFTIGLSSDVYEYKRTAFALFEVTGIIGGLFEIFEVSFSLIFGVLYSHFSKKSLAVKVRQNMMRLAKTQKDLQELKLQVSQPQYPHPSNHPSQSRPSNLPKISKNQKFNNLFKIWKTSATSKS